MENIVYIQSSVLACVSSLGVAIVSLQRDR